MLLTPKSEVEIVLYDMSKFSNKWQGIDFPKKWFLVLRMTDKSITSLCPFCFFW